jgi:hypothetical protein
VRADFSHRDFLCSCVRSPVTRLWRPSVQLGSSLGSRSFFHGEQHRRWDLSSVFLLFASQSCSQICVPGIHFSGCSCWIYLHPGPVKSSSGLPLPQRPDRRRPLRYWAVGPRRQRLYKWAREPRFVGQSNSTLSLVLISGDARQRREAPLLPPPELTAIAGSEAMESSSSSSKTQGMNSDPRSKLIDYLEPD